MIPSEKRTGSNVFFDTSFYVSLNNSSDSLHTRAKKILKDLGTFDHNSFTSNFVLLETVTVISQRIGRDEAFNFYDKGIIGVNVVRIDEELEEQSWRLFKSIQNKDISYVDCSILAVIENLKIDTLVTFDKHFNKFQKDFSFQILGLE